MSKCSKSTPLVQKRLSSNEDPGGSLLAYTAYCDWLPAIGVTSITAIMKARAAANTPKWQLAIQTASVRTDTPAAWSNLDALQTGNGERCKSDLAISITSDMFMRFGIGFKSGTDGQLAEADVMLQVLMNQCGSIIGARQFRATTTITDTLYQAVTPWIPAVAAAKVKAALIVSGVNAYGTPTAPNFQHRLAMQTAATSVEDPDAWSALEAGWTSGAAERNTGELTLSLADKGWVRFGAAYSLSATGSAQADISAVVAVKS